MKNDGLALMESSIYVKNWIEKQNEVKEESLTDWLLFNISQKIPGIHYRTFSRTVEARKTGADWEWWFLYNKSSFKLRVQAKKIKIGLDNYPSIAYTNQHGLQIDKLINDSAKENFLPFYAFYTKKCNSNKCVKSLNNIEGVYMVGGNLIYKQFIQEGKKKVTHDDILSKSVPLSCFLCCPHVDDNGLRQFLKSYHPTELNVEGNNNFLQGEYPEIPNYLSSFIELSSEGSLSEWEIQYRRAVEDVNSLVVFDRRE